MEKELGSEKASLLRYFLMKKYGDKKKKWGGGRVLSLHIGNIKAGF